MEIITEGGDMVTVENDSDFGTISLTTYSEYSGIGLTISVDSASAYALALEILKRTDIRGDDNDDV